MIGYRDISHTPADDRYRHHAQACSGHREAANGLSLRGMQVTVVHNGQTLLERQLDKTSGLMLQAALEQRGLSFRLNEQTEALLGDDRGRVRAVQFKHGEVIDADLVVMAAGIRPNTELA